MRCWLVLVLLQAGSLAIAAEPLSRQSEVLDALRRWIHRGADQGATVVGQALTTSFPDLPAERIAGYASSIRNLPAAVFAEISFQHAEMPARLQGLGLRPGAWEAVTSQLDLMAGATVEAALSDDILLRAFDHRQTGVDGVHPPLPATAPEPWSHP